MEEGEPGTERSTFKITLDKEWTHFTPLPYYYRFLSDVREVYKPKNMYHQFRKILGLSYKTKIVGYEYDLEKVESVKGLRI